jgi:L-methionine (R)-S-oxide reductase
MNWDNLKAAVKEICTSQGPSKEQKLLDICQTLKYNIPYYDWVGFYFKNGARNELKLGPFAGTPTDHTIIPFGKGICGQVALSNENFVVPDVAAQDNYIACSISVKAEIVVPLFLNGQKRWSDRYRLQYPGSFYQGR